MGTRHRSPNYPAAGLGDAVVLLKKFYAEAKRTPVDETSAAQAIGYGSLNGMSRSKLSTLKKYGLLEDIDGKFRISDRGLRIVIPSGFDDVLAALREAALAPDIFREIHASHADASTSVLVQFLMRDKAFTEDGARAFDAAYRDTVKVAQLDDPTYTPSGEQTKLEDKPPMLNAQTLKDINPFLPPPPPPAVGNGVLTLSVPYRGVSLNVRVEVIGQSLTRDHVAKVRKYLELAEEDLGEAGDA